MGMDYESKINYESVSSNVDKISSLMGSIISIARKVMEEVSNNGLSDCLEMCYGISSLAELARDKSEEAATDLSRLGDIMQKLGLLISEEEEL